jgi:PAS domain S-box-containing protein
MSEIIEKSDVQKDAEAEVEQFHNALGPFVVAAETTRMPMVFVDALETGNPIIFANDSFLSLTGYDREEVLARSFNFLLVHANAETQARIQAEYHSASSSGAEVLFRRKDGSEFWTAIFISPVRDESETIVQYFASFADLTKHKDDQAQSKRMIEELNHRVKNTLSTVQSIVWQALRTSSDPKIIKEAIEARLFALSRSHDFLTRESWKSAGLFDLVTDALEPFGVADGRAGRIVISGENIRFPPPAALALGIAFNELATNAVKYGAFSNATGSILIEWAIEPMENQLRLRWQERDGPSVTAPTRTGFGSRVIENGLAHEMEGTTDLDYQPDGLVCTMIIPAPRVGPHG